MFAWQIDLRGLISGTVLKPGCLKKGTPYTVHVSFPHRNGPRFCPPTKPNTESKRKEKARRLERAPEAQRKVNIYFEVLKYTYTVLLQLLKKAVQTEENKSPLFFK